MRDLFTPDGQLIPLFLPDADISLLHGIDTAQPYDIILQTLLEEIEWKQESIRIYGKTVPQPRLTAWYGDPGTEYKYSGIQLIPQPWTDTLRQLKALVEDCTHTRFNSVLLNLYRDENDAMGLHSDDERKLGPEPAIASVSFGATRDFVLKHKTNTAHAPVKFPLEAGSVLLMKGGTQRHWKHGILRQSRPCGPRVNLTFRTIIADK